MSIQHPYLLFLGDAPDQLAAKTAQGIAHWRPDWCVGQLRLDGCQAGLGLPDLTLEEGRAAGAKTLVIGVANRSEEHTSELQSLMRISYAVFCLKKKKPNKTIKIPTTYHQKMTL